MSVAIIVGGQYGLEGKGKVARWLGMTRGCDYAVKVGGPNSGNKVIEDGESKEYRMLSSARNSDDTTVYVFPSGSYIDIDLLTKEIKERNLTKDRVIIDPYACVIDKFNILNERAEGSFDLMVTIGSTGSGTGSCIIDRVSRSIENKKMFAKDYSELSEFIKDTKTLLGEAVDQDKSIIIEGSQGYGLSLLHSEEWPYVTSRDTTAAGILSEVGLSPLDVDDIILVIRSYPVRIGVGPMKNETTWDEISNKNGIFERLREYSMITNGICRVAEFDPELVRKAIMSNNPTMIVLNHVDYYDISTQGKEELSDKQVEKISDIENSLDVRIDFIGNGPDTIIDYEEMLGATTLNILGFMKESE